MTSQKFALNAILLEIKTADYTPDKQKLLQPLKKLQKIEKSTKILN